MKTRMRSVALLPAIGLLLVGCTTREMIFSTHDTFNLSWREKKQLMERAEDADADAALRLAKYYNYSAKKYALAIFWYRRAAALGDEGSKKILPYLNQLESKEGVSVDKPSAPEIPPEHKGSRILTIEDRRILMETANHCNADTMYQMARYYNDTFNDVTLADFWMEQAAKLGHKEATKELLKLPKGRGH